MDVLIDRQHHFEGSWLETDTTPYLSRQVYKTILIQY